MTLGLLRADYCSSAQCSQHRTVLLQAPAAELLEPRRDDEDDDTVAPSEETTMDLRLQLIRCRSGYHLGALPAFDTSN